MPRWCRFGLVATVVFLALGAYGGFVVVGLIWLALGHALGSRKGEVAGYSAYVGARRAKEMGCDGEPPTALLRLANHRTGYIAVIANLPGAERREAAWRGFVELAGDLERGADDAFTVVRWLRQLHEGGAGVLRPPIEVISILHDVPGFRQPYCKLGPRSPHVVGCDSVLTGALQRHRKRWPRRSCWRAGRPPGCRCSSAPAGRSVAGGGRLL